jgi:hypothetical protein
MQSTNSGTFIGLGLFALIVVVFVLIFFFAGKKAKKALAEFAASRGLAVQPIDEGNELEQRVVERLGIPEGGIYQDIVRLPLSSGEGWLFTRAPEREKNNVDPHSSTGSPHQYIVVFMDIPIKGRSFAAKAVPMPLGGLGLQLVEFVLAKAFGAKGIHYLDTTADYPEFSKVYNVFTEDEKGARSVILSSGVVSCLMAHPRKDPVNLSFTPKGFGLDIESMIKSRQDIDLFVQWADDLARALERG